MQLDRKKISETIASALKEDVGSIDITTSTLIEKNVSVRADILTKEDGVICGLPLCEAVFEQLDKDVKFKPQVKEGDNVYADKAVCYLEGRARPILTGERTALNFMASLSGIAGNTRKFVEKCSPYGVKVLDTRKTTPGLRYLEKYAVRIGGGYNHRMGLWDQVLIKDNHLKAAKSQKISNIVKDVRRKVQKNIKIEIEVASLKDFKEALKGAPDVIMLDNMAPDDIRKAVEMRNESGRRVLIEASGGIDIDNVEEYARSRPDLISIGSVTHSSKSLDLSLEVYA